jgi:hypothetical protein
VGHGQGGAHGSPAAAAFYPPGVRRHRKDHNALLAGIDLPGEFPNLNRVFENMLQVPEVLQVVEAAGGVVQPFVFDEETFEVYVDVPAKA